MHIICLAPCLATLHVFLVWNTSMLHNLHDKLSRCQIFFLSWKTGDIINNHGERAPCCICSDFLVSLQCIVVVQGTGLAPVTACLLCGILLSG